MRDIRDRKTDRVQRHPLAAHFGCCAELVAKRDLLHNLDVAVFRAHLDTDRTRIQVGDAGKRLQKDMMIGRIVGDHDRAGDGFGAVGVGLEGRVPEIFREMMLAHCKVQIRRCRV